MERKTLLSHLAPLQQTGHGSWMDVEQSGGIRCGFLSRINQMHDFLLLVRLEFWPATTDATLLACRIQTTFRALAQHLALKLRKGSYNLHHHTATRRSGIDHFGQTAEVRPSLGNFLHQGQHVF